MDFELTVLGNSSATPTKHRHPSAQLLSLNGRMFLIDCGEATQIQLRRFHIRFSKIDHIFISHLHGDHYLGLFGFISTLHLLGRKKTLKIYAPQGLQELVELYIRISNPEILYPIEFFTLKEENPEKIYEDNNLTIHSFPMDHRIECYGFIFRQKQQLPRMRKEAVEKYSIPVELRSGIKRGEAFEFAGKIIPQEELCEPPVSPAMYAYCSDTKYNEAYIPIISHANLLYHEATFLHDMQNVAQEKYHSTALEAATLAEKAKVKQLIIGHFSARYDDADVLLQEARTVFPETYLAEEGRKFNI